MKKTFTLIFFYCLFNMAFSQSYTLNYKDPNTYSINCGSINPDHWLVKDDSCDLQTPSLNAYGFTDSIKVDFSVRINQSGNLNSYDNAYVTHLTPDNIWVTDTVISGADETAVFDYSSHCYLRSGEAIKIKIMLENQDKTNFWQIKDGDIQVSNVTYEGQPMPVQWLYFKTFFKNDKVNLEWCTASEINNSHFIIERKTNENEWKKVGEIKGSGNSNTAIIYNHIDEESLPDGVYYYKISQYDYDGKSQNPNVSVIKIDRTGNVNMFSIIPNPTKDEIEIKFLGDKVSIVSFELFNMSSNVSMMKQKVMMDTKESLKIDLSTFAKGLYLIKYQIDDYTQTMKIMKY